MSDSDELNRLAELHQRGALSDDEFTRAKSRLLNGEGRAAADALPPGDDGSFISAINAMRRSRSDRWIGGVCGGIARMTGLGAWIWRLLFTLLVLCAGTGLFVYILLWIFVPEE